MDIWHTTNDAVQAGKRAGLITALDEGAVVVLLQMAKTLDDPEFPVIDGKFDNVTQGLYLKYCESLGLTPAGRGRLEPKKDAGGGKLAQLRGIQGGKAAGTTRRKAGGA
jgi:hypothetical protein